ncbi:MAG: YceI family protein [Candidatus Krumholzibacteriia bacterium]
MSKTIGMLAAAGLLALAGAAPAAAETYTIDETHSSVNFAVRHLMVSKTRGTFGVFEGTFVHVPGEPEKWQVSATMHVPSIDTRNEDRDAHLRSSDFFDAEKYPTMTFETTGVDMRSETEGTLRGNLTMRGVTRPVELDLEVLGLVTDPWGNRRAGFTASGTIDRRDWGLTWNTALETGGVLVGDEVEISLEIEGIATPSP